MVNPKKSSNGPPIAITTADMINPTTNTTVMIVVR